MRRCEQRLFFLILAMLAVASPAVAQQVLDVSITPPTIAIGAVYDGGEVQVSGQLPVDCEAVVRVMGERSDLHLKKKGKVGGLLWMNLDTITVQNVPAVFIIQTAKEMNQILGPNAGSSNARKLGLEYLQEETRILPDSPDKAALFKEFMKLKQSEGLYSSGKDLLRYGKTGATEKSFEVKVPIPARFPPGSYQVEVYAVNAGEIKGQASQPLEVKLVGLPALLFSFSFQNAALYGLFAVVVALVAGLVIGVVFSGSKGGSH